MRRTRDDSMNGETEGGVGKYILVYSNVYDHLIAWLVGVICRSSSSSLRFLSVFDLPLSPLTLPTLSFGLFSSFLCLLLSFSYFLFHLVLVRSFAYVALDPSRQQEMPAGDTNSTK